MKKTLLQINSVANWGSTGRIAEEIGQVAMAAGWRSIIAYGRGNPTSKSELIRIGSDFDVNWHGLESRLLDNHGLASRCATRKFIKQIDEIKPDIIHLHNIHGYYLNYPLLFDYLKRKDIPVVWTFHDCWPLTGHCSHFDLCGCDRWKSVCHECSQKNEYPKSVLFDNSKSNYQLKKKHFTSLGDKLTLVPVSYWLEGILKQSFFKDSTIHTIHNGVDLSVFKPAVTQGDFRTKYHIEKKFMAVACASSWTQRKGLSDYIELSKIIGDKYALVLVGLSEKQITALPDNIIGIPKTNSIGELVKIYSTADVVLNLSYEETLGMTTIEGMACGTPSIIYNCTASPELIDEHTGYVVNKGNIAGIFEKMQEIKEKGKLYYSSACRKRTQDIFNQSAQCKEYIALYQRVNAIGGVK